MDAPADAPLPSRHPAPGVTVRRRRVALTALVGALVLFAGLGVSAGIGGAVFARQVTAPASVGYVRMIRACVAPAIDRLTSPGETVRFSVGPWVSPVGHGHISDIKQSVEPLVFPRLRLSASLKAPLLEVRPVPKAIATSFCGRYVVTLQRSAPSARRR